MKTIIHNGKLVLPSGVVENNAIVIDNERIVDICKIPDLQSISADIKLIDANKQYVSPGFVDLHVHGGGGADFIDGTLDAARTVLDVHARHGTTSIAPTTLTVAPNAIAQAVQTVENIKKDGLSPSRVLGIHLEGPFISQKYKGAQNPNYLIEPTIANYKHITNNSNDIIRVSMAPEIPSTEVLSRYLCDRGVLLSVAHSDANYKQMIDSASLGFKHITHMFNAMSVIKSPDFYCAGGVAVAALVLDCFHTEVIGDGKHMPPEIIELLIKCKGYDGITLTTDAIRAAGMGEGVYDLGGLDVLVENGVAMLKDRSVFAGSVATIDRLLQFAVIQCNIPLHHAVNMISLNPAKQVSKHHEIGSLEIGKYADIVFFDNNYNITDVFINGKKYVERLEGYR